MRMIGQMGQVMGQMMGLRKEQKQEEALFVIDDLFNQQFRLNGKLIRSLSDVDLIRILTTNGVVETANLHAIALLMKEEGEILEELGRLDQSYVSRLKAFHLFMRLALLDAPLLLRTPSEEANDLALQLKAYELPEATKRLMFEWYEADGRYDQAENVLYELLVDGMLLQEEADDFYRRLLLLPDERLIEGGLPRDEVLEGRQQVSTSKIV
ncbi:hypothetical protein FHS14_004696 [Paenibacillus baekrokdamisoli]|nr:hypothetical protein [Paenibacillus baekrokdamisoli]